MAPFTGSPSRARQGSTRGRAQLVRSVMAYASIFVSFAGLAFGAGCAGQLRKPDEYRDDVAAVLATRAERVKACWDAELVRNPAAYGRVVLGFRVAKKTGAFERIDPIRERTTASDTVTMCVVAAVSGLTIEPPDVREADATFEWSFRAPAPVAVGVDGAP